MKRAVTLTMALAVFGTLASSAQAQRPRGPGRKAGTQITLPTGWVDWFQRNLKLDAGTKEELNRQAKRLDEEMKAVEKKFFEMAKPYLDAEQLQKLDQHLKRLESQKKLQGSLGERLKRYPAMFRMWCPRLGCDETQMEQINKILSQYIQQTKAIGRDEDVQIELAAQTYDQIFALLLPDQQQTLNDVIEGKRPAPPRPKRQPRPRPKIPANEK